jgi:hypothetical protein
MVWEAGIVEIKKPPQTESAGVSRKPSISGRGYNNIELSGNHGKAGGYLRAMFQSVNLSSMLTSGTPFLNASSIKMPLWR